MRLLRSGTLVLGGRLLQLATGAVLALLLPRLMAATEVGTFFLAQVAIGLGAVVAQAGLTFVVPAAVGEALTRGDRASAGAVCRTALTLCLLASIGVGLAGTIGWLSAGRIGAGAGFDRATLAVVVAIVPFAALGAVLAEMHRASRGVALASFLPGAQGLAAAGLAGTAFVLARRLDAAALLFAGFGGVAASVVVAFLLLRRRVDLGAASADPRAGLAGMFAAAWPALVTSVGAVAVALSDQAIAGAVGGAVDAAHYGLGLRLASFLALPLGIVNVTLTPRIVALWTEGDTAQLQRLLTTTATAAAVFAGLGLGGVLGLGIVGPRVLWDASYAPAFTVAGILGVGQVIQACGGSSGHLLMLLGHQRAFMRVSLTAGAIAILAAIAAMAWWGVAGLAVVMTTAAAAQTLACVVLAQRRLGLDTWPRLPGASGRRPSLSAW